jgi:sugar (pentulose or hexulose) kinase
MISDALPKIYDFMRSIIENIAFGIYENYKALQNFPISKVFCAGGMAKSVEILKIIANVLGTDVIVPEIKDSSFTGAAMSVLKALDYYKDYISIIKENLNFNTISKEQTMVDNYKHIYLQWKNIKNKIDIL